VSRVDVTLRGPVDARPTPSTVSRTAQVGFPAVTGSYNPLEFTYGQYGTYTPGDSTTGVPAGVTLTLVSTSAEFTAAGLSSIGTWNDTTKTITVTAANSNLDAFDFRCRIVYQPGASGGTHWLTRSRITGGTFPADTSGSATGLVVATHANLSSGYPKVYDCNLEPWWSNSGGHDGIRGNKFDAQRCEFKWCLDGMGVGFSTPSACTFKGNWVHDNAWIYPDTATPSHTDGTHNDCVQFFGGTGHVSEGNFFEGSIAAGGTVSPAGNVVSTPAASAAGQRPSTDTANACFQFQTGTITVASSFDYFRGGNFGQVNIPVSSPSWGSFTDGRYGRNARAGATWQFNCNGQTANGFLSGNVNDDNGLPITVR
jgi:hypothetical protein